MNIIDNPPRKNWESLLKRPTEKTEQAEHAAGEIFRAIQKNGDKAVQKYTGIFDGITPEKLEVSDREIQDAQTQVSNKLKTAIQTAKGNIECFHRAQKPQKVEVETTTGVKCWQEKRPIEKVGLYIPGGSAPLFSTILMLAIPAKIAGCQEIVLTTPPQKDGSIHPAILYTAHLCGITKIIKAGGIQAIAGLTFGTKSIPKVYKIFGPGNQYVTAAKQLATKYGAAIDLPAGPSELLVMADDSAKAPFVASDLLSQAEHGEDSQVIFLSTSKSLMQNVVEEIESQLNQLPRKAIAQKSLAHSKFIFVEDNNTALNLINTYAPEHLILATASNDFFTDGISNAGSVFIGNLTPESAGDYASGTNHTLPTNGFAKQYSGVNLDSFFKAITFQKINATGLKNIGSAVEIMAEAEGLHAHKNAVSLRLKNLNDQN